MKIRESIVFERIIEDGVAYGINRAYKHIDNPTKEAIKAAVIDALWNSLHEWVELDTEF